jgi:hypothetical protein
MAGGEGAIDADSDEGQITADVDGGHTRIAVDFDHTLTSRESGPNRRTPRRPTGRAVPRDRSGDRTIRRSPSRGRRPARADRSLMSGHTSSILVVLDDG